MANEELSQEAQLLKDFKKIVQSFVRETKAYIRNGGEVTDVELNTAFDRLFITYANDLDDIDPLNPIKWINKAEKYLSDQQEKLMDDEEFSEVIEQADNIGEFSIDTSEGEIVINGIDYPIYRDSDNTVFARLGIKRRGRTITSLSDLADYVSEIPAVAAIEIVYGANGTIKGYRVWVSPRTL